MPDKISVIAIVIPWFGEDLIGGAEQQAWQIATRLAQRGHRVEVLTTCCRSFQEDWSKNHLRAGIYKQKGITIRRFQVDNLERPSFGYVNNMMLSIPHDELRPGINPVEHLNSNIFRDENINSSSLLNFLKKHRTNYQAFIFIPYLYGIILNGLSLVAERVFLQPCLHNEVYAYLPQVAHLFWSARGLLFNSEGEFELAKQLYGPSIIPKSIVIGEGVEISRSCSKEITYVKNFPIHKERFVLYLGRRDTTKNTSLLIEAYRLFKQQFPQSIIKLVLAGPGSLETVLPVEGMIDLGLVSEAEKESLLSHCLALCQPSQNESYSRVMMEAWLYGRPVAVHQHCLATAIAVQSSGGGWLADSESSWANLFQLIEQASLDELSRLGSQGKMYAENQANWDKVIDRYEVVLGLKQQLPLQHPTPTNLKEIHQLTAGFSYGDAISNHALSIRDYLRNCGYKSNIYAQFVDQRIAHEVVICNKNDKIPHKAGLIYHHSIGTELTQLAINHRAAKCLIYHNITPAEFFLPYRPDVAKLLAQGREELPSLAQYFPISMGVSGYNAAELQMQGFSASGVFPIGIDPQKWGVQANEQLLRQLQDGKANLLFVGRLVPNKRQDDLIKAFAHYLTMDQEARLILVGTGDPNDPYFCYLINLIQDLHLTSYVLLAGQVNEAELFSFYRTAHLFWSMSEHEGFCVPLIESMWFDIPILAYKSSAIPETLAQAGIIFNTKTDLVQIAALAKLLVRDPLLRQTVLKAQQQRRNDFLPEKVHQSLNHLIDKMEHYQP